MSLLKSLVAALLCFIASSILCAQSRALDEIAAWQDSRISVDSVLLRHLRSTDPSERARSAIALANLEAAASLPYLISLLDDSSSVVRRNAAFALGQIGKRSSAPYLFSRLTRENDEKCVCEILDALGKCGNREDLQRLISAGRTLSPRCRSSLALSVARFAYRKVKDAEGTEYVAGMLDEVQNAPMAAYAFSRIADSSAVKRHRAQFISLLRNSSPLVRMWSASALGILTDSLSLATLCDCSVQDEDWRVRVNAIRAMRNYSSPRTGTILLSLIADINEHVSLTALSVLASNPRAYSIDTESSFLRKVLADSLRYSWRQRGEVAVLFASLSGERGIGELIPYLSGSADLRVKIIAALGETRSRNVISTLQGELRRDDPASVSSAIEAYEKVVSKEDSTSQWEFCQDLLRLLDRQDVTISYSMAVALEDTSIQGSVRAKCLPALISAYRSLKTPTDIETMGEFINVFAELHAKDAVPELRRTLKDADAKTARAAANALMTITGVSYESEIPSATATHPLTEPTDANLLEKYSGAIILTSEGEIRISFRPDAAPFTVLNFIRLAQKHFYDGLMFHRVVPNFVIQGGDPLATGFGGPGYAIRTEVNPDALFSEGAVGMASAGRDTEGSQFFITHCPTPHLDGRYTVFGYTKDFSVVNRIHIGDNIVSVKLLE